MNATRAAVLALVLAAGCGGARHAHTALPPLPTTANHPAHFPRPAEDELRPPTARRAIPLIEQRNEASPIVTIRVLFEAGSADDPPGREGLTRLAARAMAEGGTESLSYEALLRRLFPMAAQVEFHVDRDMTVFVGQVHRDHLDAFYPLFRDVILHPRFDEHDIARVRTQTTSELVDGLRGANDEALGRELLQSLIYANHPYGHPSLGTESGLAAITAADVRSQRAHVFCHDRVRLGLAGGYPVELADRLRTDMAQLPSECLPQTQLPRSSGPTAFTSWWWTSPRPARRPCPSAFRSP